MPNFSTGKRKWIRFEFMKSSGKLQYFFSFILSRSFASLNFIQDFSGVIIKKYWKAKSRFMTKIYQNVKPNQKGHLPLIHHKLTFKNDQIFFIQGFFNEK